ASDSLSNRLGGPWSTPTQRSGRRPAQYRTPAGAGRHYSGTAREGRLAPCRNHESAQSLCLAEFNDRPVTEARLTDLWQARKNMKRGTGPARKPCATTVTGLKSHGSAVFVIPSRNHPLIGSMNDKPALRPEVAVGEALRSVGRAILGDARSAIEDPGR